MKKEAMRCEAKQENRFLQSKNVSLEKLAVVLIVHQEFLTKHIVSYLFTLRATFKRLRCC